MTVNEIEALIQEIKTWDDDDCGNKYRALNALHLMNLPSSTDKRYYLRHKDGSYLNLSVETGMNYGEEIRECRLSFGDNKITSQTWSTDSLIKAATVKYTGEGNEYMEDEEYPYHTITPENIEIVDYYGKVYNTKPYSMYTYAKIKDLVNNNNKYSRDLEWNYRPKNLKDVYCECHLLRSLLIDIEEYKNKIQKYGKYYNPNCLGDLYNERKNLVSKKGEAIRYGRTYKTIQKKLDVVNKKIVKLGGR